MLRAVPYEALGLSPEHPLGLYEGVEGPQSAQLLCYRQHAAAPELERSRLEAYSQKRCGGDVSLSVFGTTRLPRGDTGVLYQFAEGVSVTPLHDALQLPIFASQEAKLRICTRIAEIVALYHTASLPFPLGAINMRSFWFDAVHNHIYMCPIDVSGGIERSDDIKHVYWKPPNELEQSVQEAGCSLITLAGDVYSLAVVIMEIVSGVTYLSLFRPEECGSVSSFLSKLSKSGALQLLCLPDSSLRSMLRRSLSMKPQQRPAVDELLFCLREAVLKTAIDDDRGRVFWQEKFGLMESVPWSLFSAKLFDECGFQHPEKTNGRYIMLRALFAHLNNMPIDSEDFSIPIAEFDNVLRWIGPMTDGLIESVYQLLKRPWFHGRIERSVAEQRVRKSGNLSFLFRFSIRERGSFAITASTGSGFRHYKILHQPGLGFLISKVTCQSLDEIVFKYAQDLGLKIPAKGSAFASLLNPTKPQLLPSMNKYSLLDDDDELA